MKLFFLFDAAASSYEIKSQLSQVGTWPGVSAMDLLERVSGEAPRYCAEVVVADDQAQTLRDRVHGMQMEYAGYVSNLREVSYRTV
jgi:hypothetical protein